MATPLDNIDLQLEVARRRMAEAVDSFDLETALSVQWTIDRLLDKRLEFARLLAQGSTDA